jgi:hypothetical protein
MMKIEIFLPSIVLLIKFVFSKFEIAKKVHICSGDAVICQPSIYIPEGANKVTKGKYNDY